MTEESPADFGKDEASQVKRWLAEIESAESDELKKYDDRCKRIEKRYREESDKPTSDRRYALLWANVQTMQPAVYSRQPLPVVATRHKDRNMVARTAAEVIERCLAYAVDSYDFQERMLAARDEYLLYARATLWVRYVPTLEGDKVTYEEVLCDFVNRDDFLTNKARTWQEVRWGARKVYLSRDELVTRFGKEKGERVTLDHKVSEGDVPEGTPSDLYHKALVYEIWDKGSKKAFWVSKGFVEAPLDVRDDPLGLRDFFPFPRPAYGTTTTSSLIPVPDYLMYQDQAEEIDLLTRRIGLMVDALKVRGFYAGDEKNDLARLLKAGDNELIPVNNWAVMGDKGGVSKLVEWFPIDMVVSVLQGCIDTRRQIIEDVYQITGLSDIVRGASDPSETATAQQIKTQWGGLRIRDRQAELQRLARDVMRIKGEIIAERFGQETLAAMSGMQLPTEEEKAAKQREIQLAQQQHQMQAQEYAAAGQEPPPAPPGPDPETERMLGAPTWEEVIALLRDDPARRFLIDVETDSTIAPDEQKEKEQRIEFITAISTFLTTAGPIIQAAPEMAETIGQMMLFGTRSFHVGREMEDTIERGMQALAERASQPPPTPEADPSIAAKMQGDMQLAQMKAQADGAVMQARVQNDAEMAQATLQAEMQKQQADHEHRMAELQLNAQNEQAATQATLQAALQKQADDHQRRMIEISLKAKHDQKTMQMAMQKQLVDHQIEVSEAEADAAAEDELAMAEAAKVNAADEQKAQEKAHEKAEREQARAQIDELKQVIVDLSSKLGKVRAISKVQRGPGNRIVGAEYDDGAKVGLRFGKAGEIIGTEVLQ